MNLGPVPALLAWAALVLTGPPGSHAVPAWAADPPSPHRPSIPRPLPFPPKVKLADPGSSGGRANKAGIAGFDRRRIPMEVSPAQAKHVPGSKSYVPGKTRVHNTPETNPEKLLSEFRAGQHRIIGVSEARGYPFVDFGRPIGTWAGLPTRYGQIHFGENGAHIVPASPFQY